MAIISISLFLLALCLPIYADAASPIAPRKDPWYNAPEGWEKASPGTILRERKALGNVTSVYGTSETFNLLYRTTNSLYEPSWAVTTVMVPTKMNSTKSMLSYQIPYNSVDLDASPSYALNGLEYSTPNGLIYQDIRAALTRGWFLNIPDFEAHEASFGAGVLEGHATLDSIRASLAFLKATKGQDLHAAMWGYSGGSIASEWAAELQVQYAPELKILGAALGGVVSNGSDTLSILSQTPAVGLIPEGLLGITQQYPQAHQFVLSQLKTEGPHNKTGFLIVEEVDFLTAAGYFANQDIWDYFIHGKDSILQSQYLRDVFDRDGYMGYHGVPEIPLYIYKAIHDQVTPIGDTDVLVQRYCEVGANIVYNRETSGDHLSEEYLGDPYALQWLESVFAGTNNHVGCDIKNVTWS